MKLWLKPFQDNAFILFHTLEYVVKMSKATKISMLILIPALLLTTIPISILSEDTILPRLLRFYIWKR